MNSLLGDSTLTLDEKYDSIGNDWTLLDNQTDIYFTEFSNSPIYYLLKFGTGNIDATSHFLFKNIGDVNYGVIDFSLEGLNLLNISSISHIIEFGGDDTDTGTSIPAPAGFVLLLLALFGSVLVRKHK